MAKIKVITTPKAPTAIGPYSQAMVYNGLIFCAGQIGIDPSTGKLAGETIEIQTGQVLENIKAILKKSGSDLKLVLKTTVYLRDINDFISFNNLYEKYFPVHKPARSTVEVSNLPKNALVEIEAIAARIAK